MKFAVLVVLAILVVGGVGYMVLEHTAREHHPLLRPPAQAQEGSRGAITDFKTTRYEPNGGNARAYAVVQVVEGRKTYRVGRMYVYSSTPGQENWKVATRKTLWDESRGDSAPLVTPYWSIR